MFRQAVSELRRLLERLANRWGMQCVLNSIRDLDEDARRDEELRAWFKRLNAFIRKVCIDLRFVLALR